jgi:four helix bundle protein
MLQLETESGSAGQVQLSVPPRPLPYRPRPRPSCFSFKDTPMWQSAMTVAEKVFAATANLPPKEDYGFTSQIRRSALRISGDIAEACGRNRAFDKAQYHYIARGAVTETQNHLEYGRRVGYLDAETVEQISRLLSSLYEDLTARAGTVWKTLE